MTVTSHKTKIIIKCLEYRQIWSKIKLKLYVFLLKLMVVLFSKDRFSYIYIMGGDWNKIRSNKFTNYENFFLFEGFLVMTTAKKQNSLAIFSYSSFKKFLDRNFPFLSEIFFIYVDLCRLTCHVLMCKVNNFPCHVVLPNGIT